MFSVFTLVARSTGKTEHFSWPLAVYVCYNLATVTPPPPKWDLMRNSLDLAGYFLFLSCCTHTHTQTRLCNYSAPARRNWLNVQTSHLHCGTNATAPLESKEKLAMGWFIGVILTVIITARLCLPLNESRHCSIEEVWLGNPPPLLAWSSWKGSEFFFTNILDSMALPLKRLTGPFCAAALK